MFARLSLRTRVLLFFLLLGVGAAFAITLGAVAGYHRLGLTEARDGFVQSALIAVFLTIGLVVWIWYLFDLNVAKPIDRLSGELRARAHAEGGQELDATIARHLGDLAPAAAAAARSLEEARNALAETVARETTRIADEKARLEALMSDIPFGLILCTSDHQIAFYNTPAADYLGADFTGPGLDRTLFDYLRAGPIRHAYERLATEGDGDIASDLLCVTREGAHVLAARMRLAPGGGGAPAYALSLRDITQEQAAEADHAAREAAFIDAVRRASANLSALAEAVIADETAPLLMGALRDEAAKLSTTVSGHARDEGVDRGTGILPMTRASDLMDGWRARAEAAGLAVGGEAAALLLRCNGFDLIALLSGLTEELLAGAIASEIGLVIAEEGSGAVLRLCWSGDPVPVGRLERWLDRPLDPGHPQALRRSVLITHATDIWPEPMADGRQSLCLPILSARRAEARPAPVARRVTYDFDLLTRARNAPAGEARLDDLTYVVFDSETTGLLPHEGDEMVQLAAIRIVNGRRVAGEIFDLLVNPGRPIPPASTAVHGITDAMVADAPSVTEAVSRFHRFAEGAVLVAHNAPFDMEFLRRTEGATGLTFDHPVFDTVLLSAVLWGQHEVHTLDALSHRLGVSIAEEDRHTALGDSVATADVFLKMVQMLQGRGFETFGSVIAEVARHRRLLKDLN
ncbi:3'-5' exonuclease [Frigidibacter sp. RF13]|uniref:3'-5' exonuclease n=1 Tax=Frigidibacter sp. RF13 TaxID=2997340 RepID=UPI00227189E1|nr:3'-5' exonuclease [Frigidibacter sp. RF13]MCY1127494.1 3'-5' exonuclease [Frigidibacter sp. RF13]